MRRKLKKWLKWTAIGIVVLVVACTALVRLGNVGDVNGEPTSVAVVAPTPEPDPPAKLDHTPTSGPAPTAAPEPTQVPTATPPPPTSTPLPTPTPPPPPTSTPPPTPTPSPPPTETPAPTIGSVVELGTSTYTVNAIMDPALARKYAQVPEGNRLIAVDITQVAVRDGTQHNLLLFHLQDTEGFVYEMNYIYSDIEPIFPIGELLRGQRVRGWVPYMIPATAKPALVLVSPKPFGVKYVIADLSSR